MHPVEFLQKPLSSSDQEKIEVRPLLKNVFRLGTPSVLENLLMSGLLLTDTLMLAQLEYNRLFLAATAISGVFFWRLTSVIGCTQTGAAAYVARRWGEDKYDEAGRALTHVILLAMAIGATVSAILYGFVPNVCSLLSDDPQVILLASSYLRILLLVFPIRLALLNLTSSMRAAGDTVSPLLMMFCMVIANVFLNWVFIFGNLGMPRLEMDGAAIASAICFSFGCLGGIFLLVRGVKPRRLIPQNVGIAFEPETGTDIDEVTYQHLIGAGSRGKLRLHRNGLRFWLKDVTRTILRVSRPAFGEEILYSIGFLVFIGMVGRFGTDVLAAHSSTVRIESLSFTAGWGVAVATSTMIGQALGAGQHVMARRLFSLNTTMAMVLMGLMGIGFIMFPDFLLGWFELEDDVLIIGRMLMFIIGIEQPLMGMAMTISGGLRGSGETTGPFVTQIFGVLGMRIGMGYVLAWPLGMGIAGIYWATALDWLMRSAVLLYFVWRGKWERVAV